MHDGDSTFCCHGCHAVYTILNAQGATGAYEDSPVFKEAVRSGLISNPVLIEQIRSRHRDPASETHRLHLDIAEMWCPSCAEVIKLILLQQPGIVNCVVDYATDLASVEYDPLVLGPDKIVAMVDALGYKAHRLEDAAQRKVGLLLYLRFAIAAFCGMNIMMLSYPIYASYFNLDWADHATLFSRLCFALAIPVVLFSAWPIYRRFASAIQVGIYGMETLVVTGVTAAFSLSTYHLAQGNTHVYFDSMSVIVAFVLLGKIIETRAKFSAKDALLRLGRSVPRRGKKRFDDGTERYVPVKELAIGDTVVVATGETIALDGEVIEGVGACDEALMTGEAIPVSKQQGALVLGGTILKQGSLVIRLTADATHSALQQIINMVETDVTHKAQYIRTVDRVVQNFVPVVLLTALVTGIVDWLLQGSTEAAIIHAVSVLLISCPCAIGIAAPLAESHVLNAMAKLGAIVRNRGCLPRLAKASTFAFDKTGTVTEGAFRLTDGLDSLGACDQAALKALAGKSLHPISNAIYAAIDGPEGSIKEVVEVPGKGIYGNVSGVRYALGSRGLMQQLEVAGCKEELTESSDAVVTKTLVAKGEQQLTTLSLGDQIRSGIREVIAELGAQSSLLVSGDSAAPVQAVARRCGFTNAHHSKSPLEKRELIEALRERGEVVCMVGDGINDAPSLAAADIGISVVSATDMSIQVSDILLTTDRLDVLPKMLRLAKRGQRIVHQNLFWAFFYNVIGIGLAIGGVLSPLFAAGAMVCSSLIVLLNAQRVRRV